jgi:hypothetical protein
MVLQDTVADIDWSTVEFTHKEARPLKRHYFWATRVCFQLSVPLLVSSIFFGMLYVSLNSVTQSTHISSQVAKAMGDRTVREGAQHMRLLEAGQRRVGGWVGGWGSRAASGEPLGSAQGRRGPAVTPC